MTLISESEYSSLQYAANTIRAERDAAREELNDCRDALQDWQVAADLQASLDKQAAAQS